MTRLVRRSPSTTVNDPSRTPEQIVAVVTGGAGGIGRAMASALVERGYAVVVTDIDEAAARRTAAEVRAALGLGHDVRSEADHERVAAAAAQLGRVAVWCNNAGVMTGGPITEQPATNVEALVDVNITGVIWGCRVAARTMGEHGGDIINTASLSGHGPVPELAVYAAGKAAVHSLSMSLDSELGPQGIRVHAICPDGADTNLLSGVDGRASALIHSGGRLLQPQEIAEAAVAMIGTRRVVRTLPVWRGAMMRLTSLAPSTVMRFEPLMRSQGDRARASRRRRRAAAGSR